MGVFVCGSSGTTPTSTFMCSLSFLFCSCRYSGGPFGANAPLPLVGAALRGKDFGFAWRLLRTHLAPLLGELSRKRLRGRQSWTIAIRQKKLCTINHIVGDGLCAVPLCVLHSMKIDTPDQNNLSLRDQFANWSWQSASPLHSIKSTAVSKRNGLPRRFAPRNDRGFLYVAFSFSNWQSLYTGAVALRIAPP